MIQIKDKKGRYRNTDKKMKAAFRGRGFHLYSKIVGKSKNSTLWILPYNRRNCILFFRLQGGGEMANLQLSDILPLLENVRRSGDGFSARCPSHSDQKNSLTLKAGDKGKPVLKCHTGCTYQQVITTLESASNGNGHKRQKPIEAIYDYADENGNLLYQNVRFEGKEFRWRRRDQNGGEFWNLNGIRRVPYSLSELVNLPDDYAFIMTEGEKDSDTLKAHRLIATNHKNWQPEFNYLLKNKNVVILQDHDSAGVALAQKAAKIVFPDAAAVKIVDCFAREPLPDKHGKDVSDYLKTHSIDDLLALIRSTPKWKPVVDEETSYKSEDQGFRVVRLSDVQAEEITWLWKPFIPVGEFTIIEGIEGLGKSWISCALTYAVSHGIALPFSDSEPLPSGNVLMLSAEDSLSHTVKPRLLSMGANLDRIFALDEVFTLDNSKDLIKFEAVIAEYEPKLVTMDPLFSYTGGKNLNQESDSRPLARKLIAIAQKYQCAIVGVRHIGKAKGNGDARAAGLGSVAWSASARSVLLVGRDEETGEKAVCQTKNNLAGMAKFSIGFEIENGQFFWKAVPSRLTKEKMLAQPQDDEKKTEQTEAVAFLQEALKYGERESKDIEKEAKLLGITNYALRKARTNLGVKTFKRGGNFGGEKGWFIQLPHNENNENSVEEADNSEPRHLQSNQSNKTSYHSNLAEDVRNNGKQYIQQFKTASSTVLVPQVQLPEVCKCGAGGEVGQRCRNCGETLIPF